MSPAARQRGMGRGLAAILPESASGEPDYREIPVQMIRPNPDQPRRRLDPETISGLAESIAEAGVIQPLIVRPLADGRYELIAGERRWRAAREAGRETVPALLRDEDEPQRLQTALIENVVREDLNPVDEARACAALVEDLGLSKEELARRLGRGREAGRRGRDRRRAGRARMKGILGGTFDPPHLGHVALAEAARDKLPIDELEIWVEEHPGHRGVVANPEPRLKMAQAAFPDLLVRLDPHPFTAEAVRGGEEALFVVGADQAADFHRWKDPEAVLQWVKLAVGTRGGFDMPDLSRWGDRVVPFELASPEVSSSEVRERVTAGETVDDFVPPAVARLIEELELYR